MSLLLKYSAADTGTRPIPPGTQFWSSPAVTLNTADGNYVVGTNPTIDVTVTILGSTAYQDLSVQVWVCDPSTVAGPSTALQPYSGATSLTLSGYTSTVTGSSVLVPVTGFKPYTGISTLPGGHCCLIANCFGTTSSGQDGNDLNEENAINLPNEVQTDPHVAQHNIFADAVMMIRSNPILSFPFKAATPLRTGTDHVGIELVHVNRSKPLEDHDIAFLKRSRFKGLPLHSAISVPKSLVIGGEDQRASQHLRLDLQARKAVTLKAQIEFDEREKPGGVHVFEVVQKSAAGKVQGGFRLLAVHDH